MSGERASCREVYWTWSRIVVCALVAALAVGACLGGWMLYRSVSVSLQAEYTLHATIFAVQLVEQFVAEHKRWPRSWDELETLSVPSDRLYFGIGWPEAAREVRQRVFIDFEVDPRGIAAQDPMTVTAIKPIGPHYEFRDYGYVPSLQNTIRRSTKGDP